MLDTQTAKAALTDKANTNVITAQQVEAILQNVKGTTLASILQVTDVGNIAAANKGNIVHKVTKASIQLFNNVADYNNVYAAAVKRTAAAIADNDAQAVAGYTVADTASFTHTNTFSLVQNKKDPSKFYLFAIYSTADSLYFINSTLATKEQVAALMQPAAAKKLLEDTSVVHNKTHDIMHTVQVRTIALDSIVQLKAMKQVLAV